MNFKNSRGEISLLLIVTIMEIFSVLQIFFTAGFDL